MSGSVPQKIVLKSTTNISLNDRFSSIKTTNTNAVQGIRNNVAAERQASVKNRRLALQMANRPQVVAALKLKKKSLRQRLGVQARLTPRQPMRGGQNGNMQFMNQGGNRGYQARGNFRGRSRGYPVNQMNRGNRGTSPRGFKNFRGRGGPSFRGVGQGFRGVGEGMRGAGRGMRRGRGMRGGQDMRGQGRGRGQYRGSSPGRQFRGRASRGFRGQRSRGRGGPRGRGGNNVNREFLDNELDVYMSKTKSTLDNEIDSYMSAGIAQDI